MFFVFLLYFCIFLHLIDGNLSASGHKRQIDSRPTPLSICVLLMCFLRVHVRKYVIKHMMHFSGSLPPCVIVPAIGCIWLMEVLTLADSPRLIVVQANIIVSLFSKRADRPFHLVSPCTCTLEICQKFSTTGLLFKKFYTLEMRQSGQIFANNKI